MKKNSKDLLFERMHTIGGMPLKENDHINMFYEKHNINPENLSYLGRGDFGEAYSIDDERVLKITTSKSECEIANKILNSAMKFQSFADIYGVENINGRCYIIMEELEIESEIEDRYYELESILSTQDLPVQYIHYFDEDEYDGELSDEMREFINAIDNINSDYRRLGIEASDIRPENLGYSKKTGELKAFDIDDKQK